MASGAAARVEPASGGARRSSVGSAVSGRRRSSKLPVVETVEKLREVVSALSKTPQGQGAELVDCVQGVATPDLLRHSDREVRTWAAKCLAEGLRIFAPEPPLNARQLRGTLELFLEQLGTLTDPTAAAFVHAFGLLEQLVEVNAFMLIFDCEEHEDLLVKTVKVCLAAARGSEGAHLEGLLLKVLTSVLGEADSIPRPALMELIQELAPRRQSKFASGLVRQVLAGLASHSAVLSINEFLNDALYGRAQGDGGGVEGLESSSGKEPNAALFCAVYEIFAIDQALVARVVPNMYVDLQCEDAERRRAVTILVGRMLAHHTPASTTARPRPPLISTHPLLLDRYLERLADAHEEVRLAALEGAASLLTTVTSLSGAGDGPGGAGSSVSYTLTQAGEALRQRLLERCLDPSDAVRLCAVRVVADAAASVAGLALLAPILPEAFRRVLDKRPRVREACALAAAELYAKHALPAWTGESAASADSLAWVPQLLCEAYSVFAGGQLGQTARLEELIEQHLLGCGAPLQPRQRALALLGFCSSAASQDASAQGLHLLLRRKCEANAALRRYLQLRIPKAAPALEAPPALGQALATEGGSPGRTAVHVAAAALEGLGRLSPCTEDKNARVENLLVHLRSLDAVRDRALWNLLDRLSHPTTAVRTGDMESLLGELDRLLRVHRLTDLAPLFRRALLSTWLLPDQVPTLLEAWAHSGQQAALQPFEGVLQVTMVDLSKCFPGAFMRHVEAVMQHLMGGGTTRSRAALRVLGALGKRVGAVQQSSAMAGAGEANGRAVTDVHELPESQRGECVDVLLKAAKALCEDQDAATCGAVCRKAVRACSLVHGSGQHEAVEQVLRWVEGEGAASVLALHLAAACFGQSASGQDAHAASKARLLAVCREILGSEWRGASGLHLAALEVCMAAGAETEVLSLVSRASAEGACLPPDVILGALRALRHGALPLTTPLLSQMAAQLTLALAEEAEEEDLRTDAVAGALQKLLRPSKTGLRMADRLRLCTTLPALFALSPSKKSRDAMGRALQTSFLKAMQQCTARQEPLLDFAIACFLHFLSRLDFFRAEAGPAYSAYPQSTKLASFVCEALLRSDPLRSAELAGIALRVCERVRFFVDREEPASDAVHRAAHVLRYAVERRCPELGAHGACLQGASRGSMPAELFALGQGIAGTAPEGAGIVGGPRAALPSPAPRPLGALAAKEAAARAGDPAEAATPQKCAGRRGSLGSSGARAAGLQASAKRQRLA